MMFAEGLFILFQKTENIRLRGAPYFHLNFLLYVHRIVQGQPFNKLGYTYIYIDIIAKETLEIHIKQCKKNIVKIKPPTLQIN